MLRAELSGSFDTGDLNHRIIVGIDSDEFENDQFALQDRSTDQSINIFNPVYGNSPASGLSLGGHVNRVETQESVGFYVQDQISLTEQLELRIGARVDNYDQNLLNRRSNKTSSYSETQVTPQLGVVYQATDELSLYAVYGENFRPLSGATDANGLDPNLSESTEIGVKFSLANGALNGNFAIFDLEQSNIATFDADYNPTAIGAAESSGFEFDLTGNITESTSVWFSYSNIDAQTLNDYTDYISYNFISAGSNLLNVAENQATLQIAEATQLAGKPLTLIGTLVYVGDRSGQFGHPTFELPSYTTLRVAADYQVSESLGVSAEINNLFDEDFYTNSYSSTWVQPGAPTWWRLSATYSF